MGSIIHEKGYLQKLHYLGYMTQKLFKCYLNLDQHIDRDSYQNKRIGKPVELLIGNCNLKVYLDYPEKLKLIWSKKVTTGLLGY